MVVRQSLIQVEGESIFQRLRHCIMGRISRLFGAGKALFECLGA
jgi:hypothetical protein